MKVTSKRLNSIINVDWEFIYIDSEHNGLQIAEGLFMSACRVMYKSVDIDNLVPTLVLHLDKHIK